MKVKKGVSITWKWQTYQSKTLAHVTFFHTIFQSSLYAFPSGSSDSAFTQRGAKRRVVWMDGWMNGWVGDLLPPYNFFIFKYNNKHHALIPKMCSKVASAFQIKSYEHFKFQNSEFYERFPPRKRIGIFLSKKASPPLRNLVIFRKKCHKKTMIS